MRNRVKTIEVLRTLPILFKYAEVAKFVSNPNVFLTRALKLGYVTRLMKGAYLNLFKGEFPEVEEVASFLRWPSYVSCEWALNYHGLILQSPLICTVITLSGSVGVRNRVVYQGITIEYSGIAESLFWGFKKVNGFNMATPEKALIDTVYLRKYIPFPDELETYNLDMKELKKIVQRYPGSTQKLVERILQGDVGTKT